MPRQKIIKESEDEFEYILDCLNNKNKKQLNEKRLLLIDKCHHIDFYLNIKESIYNKEFYTKYAVDGKTHIENRFQSIYTFSSDRYGVIH